MKSLAYLKQFKRKRRHTERFVSKSTAKCLSFSKVIRKESKFEWTRECEQGLTQLKAYLASVPQLANPNLGDDLYLYLAISESAVSSAQSNKKASSPRSTHLQGDGGRRDLLLTGPKNGPCVSRFSLEAVPLLPNASNDSLKTSPGDSYPLQQVLQKPET